MTQDPNPAVQELRRKVGALKRSEEFYLAELRQAPISPELLVAFISAYQEAEGELHTLNLPAWGSVRRQHIFAGRTKEVALVENGLDTQLKISFSWLAQQGQMERQLRWDVTTPHLALVCDASRFMINGLCLRPWLVTFYYPPTFDDDGHFITLLPPGDVECAGKPPLA